MVKKILSIGKEYAYTIYSFSRYSRATKQFIQCIEDNGQLFKGSTSKPKILMIIEQWTSTPLPFWEVYLYVLLKNKGIDVAIIYSDGRFSDEGSDLLMSIRDYYIKRVLPESYISLSDYKAIDVSSYTDWIDFAVRVNAIHHMKGELNQKGIIQYEKCIRLQLEWKLSRWLSVNFKEYNAVFCPGGIYADTSLIRRLCEKNGVRFYSMDSGIRDVVLTSTNGVAAHLDDIKRSYQLFSNDKLLYATEWKKLAYSLLEERMKQKDLFAYQNIDIDDDINSYGNVGYLLMMNSVWDSAALGINTEAFDTFNDFVVETVRWVLDYTDEHVTVRQHPMDRSSFQRGTDDYASLLEKLFPENKRVHYIKAEDKVNSYKLIKNSKAVLVYSSTVAIEAVILGKPVVCVSNCYYSDMGFVFKANSREEYVYYLNCLRDGKITIGESFKERASLIYFLTQKCNWLKTKFVPSQFHFKYYENACSCSDIEKLGNIDILLQSIIEDIPVSYLNAKRILMETSYEKLRG